MSANSDFPATELAARDEAKSGRNDSTPVSAGSSLSIQLTVPEAIAALTAEPRFRRLVRTFAGLDGERILRSADGSVT